MKNKRINELEQKITEHRSAITKLNHWLIENPHSADRNKVHSDKGWHEHQISVCLKKIKNIRNNAPENGVANEGDRNFLNNNITRKIQ